MFRIKICGITSVEDALEAKAAGADAIGLNFYEKSPRFVQPTLAAEIVSAVDPSDCVGVFVNKAPASISYLASDVRFRWIQLHGDEPATDLAELQPPAKVIRARRLREGRTAEIAADLAACQQAGRLPVAVLIDAAVPGEYGGTGTIVAWEELADRTSWLGSLPLILAGGLTPDNVAEAIRTVQPDAVDVASGVESSPGVKDPAKVRSFVEAAAEAFAVLDQK